MQNLNKQLHIFDTTEVSSDDGQYPFFLYWRIWGNSPERSILYYQEHSQAETTLEYLHWLHCFSEFKIKDKPLREHIALSDGYSAWWLSILFEKHPAWYEGAMFEIFKLRALEQYIEKYGFNRIVLHSADSRLNSVLERWCSDTGRDYVWKNEKTEHSQAEKNLEEKNSPWIFCLAKTMRTLLAWLLKCRIRFRLKAHTVCRKGIAMAAWFPNMDSKAAMQGKFHSSYWGCFHKLLSNINTPVNWLLIQAEDSSQISKNVALRDRFENQGTAKLTFWEEHVGFKDVVRATFEWLKVSRVALKLDDYLEQICEWPSSKLVITPYIRPLWFKSTRSGHLLKRLLMRIGIVSWAKNVGEQQVALAPSENQPWERIFYWALRKQQTPLLCAVMHTTAWANDTRYMVSPLTLELAEFVAQMPDKFLCNAKRLIKNMRQGGYPESRLALVEALRYQHLENSNEKSFVVDPNSKKILLVVTTIFPKEVTSQFKILSEVIAMGTTSQYSKIIVKPHPSQPVEKYIEQYLKKKSILEIGTESIAELLKPGVVLYSGNSTTVPIEAAYKGIPFIVQAAENDFNLCPLSDTQGVCFVHTAEELKVALDKPEILDIDEDYFCLNSQLPLWDSFLKDALKI